MSRASGGQFAFVIETKREHARSWSRVEDSVGHGGIALGGSVEAVTRGTVRTFAHTVLERYVAYLATVPEYVEFYLHEEDVDIRVHVWDLSKVSYDELLEPDDYPAHRYSALLKHAGIKPTTTVTWPALEVWRHLSAAVEVNEAPKQPDTNAQPSSPRRTNPTHTRPPDIEDER